MAPRKSASKATGTARKTPQRKAPAASAKPKPAPQKTIAVSAAPAPVQAPKTSVVETMKKKEMIEKVAELSGVKRSEAKKAMVATLKIIGDALQEGTELNLPPLGKISVNRQKEATGAHVIIAKLRRSKAMLNETPDAEDAEGSASEER
ncbi:HU family DNA-binding protein [Celeribacter neptunius]|uniref:DNA-binding protein n=1 Tax=Celeribacter neptunius TaxID=588602 RepID=A0A1I3LIK0_9RHOB|nr:HU family DNA-binding protein [Celeribacter neptunius]SFI84582.1 DNA-binding protein [Celeribacter neptunius]